MVSRAIDHPRFVILAFVFRRSLIGAMLWGAIFGIVVASSAFGFEAAFNTPASRAQAAALGANAGLQAMLGPPHNIEAVAGFTAWRSMGAVILLGAIWSILLATKNFRGEEEAGRWELLLSGQTTARRAVLQTFLGLGLSLGAMFLVVASISVIVGQSLNTRFNAPDALFLALSSVCAAGIFMAIGALISQIAATRRQATTWTAAIFGLSFVLRAVSDASSSMSWFGWFSPIRWIDKLQPLTNPSPVWLVPIGVFILSFVLLTVYVASQRDLGSSLLRGRDSNRSHMALLHNSFTTSLRLLKGNMLGWLVGIGLFSYLFGTVSITAATSFSDSSPLRRAISVVGGGNNSGAKLFISFILIIISTMVMLVAATHLAAAREEEAKGFLDNLLVRRVTRVNWLMGRIALGVATFLAAGMIAGLAAWLGAYSQNFDISLSSLLAAGLNIAVPAVLVLSIGVLTFGFLPRATSFIAYGVIVWSFLIEIVVSFIKAGDWLLNTSILHWLAAAPAVDPHWDSLVVMLLISLCLILAGTFGFVRRDLASE